MSSKSQPCPSEETLLPVRWRGFGVFQGHLGHSWPGNFQQIHFSTLRPPGHGRSWLRADPLRRECLGSLQVQGFDLCSVSFYLGSSRLGGGFQPLHLFSGSSDHPDTEREKYHHCDLPYEPCTTGSEEHGRGSTHFGEIALSSSPRAAMPVLGCPARWGYPSVLESLGCSWHLPFACRAAPPLRHIPSRYCAAGSPLCCVFC